MVEKFDDKKLLFSAVIEAGGEDCSFVLGIEGIGPDALPPICREGTLDEAQTILEEMANDLRRAFAVYVVESESKKKTRKKKSSARKTAARSAAPPAEVAEDEQASKTVEADDVDTKDGASQIENTEVQDDQRQTADEEESSPPTAVEKTEAAVSGQANFFDGF